MRRVHVKGPRKAGACLLSVAPLCCEDAAQCQALHVAGVGSQRPPQQVASLGDVAAAPLTVRKDEERVDGAAGAEAVNMVAPDGEGQFKEAPGAGGVPGGAETVGKKGGKDGNVGVDSRALLYTLQATSLCLQPSSSCSPHHHAALFDNTVCQTHPSEYSIPAHPLYSRSSPLCAAALRRSRVATSAETLPS